MRDVAQFFKVLADESRLQILWLLFNRRELCVCDIIEALGITQSKASRHLATLRHAGLVVDRREGAWSYYSMRAPAGDLERDQLELLRSKLASHLAAARVLRALEAWLERKGREASCAPREASGPARRAEAAVARGRSAGGRR